jgi:hypothetical protein
MQILWSGMLIMFSTRYPVSARQTANPFICLHSDSCCRMTDFSCLVSACEDYQLPYCHGIIHSVSWRSTGTVCCVSYTLSARVTFLLPVSANIYYCQPVSSCIPSASWCTVGTFKTDKPADLILYLPVCLPEFSVTVLCTVRVADPDPYQSQNLGAVEAQNESMQGRGHSEWIRGGAVEGL